MITQLRSSIQSFLGSLTTLGVVYDYHTPTPEAYPCATFELESISNEAYDSCNNKVVYTFDLFIMQVVDDQTERQEARHIIDSVLDELVEKINKSQIDSSAYKAILQNLQIYSVKSDKGQAIA